MSNINDIFFDGHYKDIWKSMIPEELTVREVDFMLTHFSLQPGQLVLDLMCGYGRHAISLARKGMAVTAVDNLGDYTGEIQETADKEELPLRVVQADVLTYKPEGQYSLAICMGNSLNFFKAEDCVHILTNIAGSLQKGGHLLINSWTIAEIAIRNFREKTWSTVGELKMLSDAQFLFRPSRIETETIIIAPDGTTETRMAIDYIFSLNEMEAMLSEAGFSLIDAWSIPGRKKFAAGDPRVYITAQKN